MSLPVQSIAVAAPGNQGLNTEMSPFQSSQDFALRADNTVIDAVGRLSSREAFSDYVFRTDLTEPYDIVRMDALDSGSVFGIAALGRTVVNTSKTTSGMNDSVSYDLGLADYTSYVGVHIDGDFVAEVPSIRPTNGIANCQLVPFKDAMYVFSKGEAPMVFDGTTGTKLSDAANYLPPETDDGVIAEELNGDVACAAYGRLWVSGVNDDYNTIYYSDLLIPEQWYDGKGTPTDDQNTAGIINVSEYWPTGEDQIQGIAAHNGFLVIFGRKSILIYSGAQGDPAGEDGLKLEDAIRDVGLINQDAMCNVGTDHLFVDYLGVRALGRVIQEKSTPMAEPSMNVATEIRDMVYDNTDTVRMFTLPRHSLALCLFPEIQEAFVFQLGQPSVSGGLRVTRWTGCDFFDSVTAYVEDGFKSLLAGRNGRGICRYKGYDQPTSYNVVYESPVINATGNQMSTLLPKSMSFSFESNKQDNFNAIWGFGSNMSYSQKVKTKTTGSDSEFQTSHVAMRSSGEMLRVGFNVEITGEPISIQQISINAQAGRVIV